MVAFLPKKDTKYTIGNQNGAHEKFCDFKHGSLRGRKALREERWKAGHGAWIFLDHGSKFSKKSDKTEKKESHANQNKQKINKTINTTINKKQRRLLSLGAQRRCGLLCGRLVQGLGV